MNPNSKRTGERGFTLIETLICLVITALISILLTRTLVNTFSRTKEELQDRTMLNSARLALGRVVKELEGLGMDTYVSPTKVQPKLLYCGPYQIVFNSDGDQNIAVDPNNPRRGPINPAGDGPISLGDAIDGVLLYEPNDAFANAAVGDLTAGAETIRIGLDVGTDGVVEPEDNSDDMRDDSENDFWRNPDIWDQGGGAVDMSMLATPNPLDSVLVRESVGYGATTSTEFANIRRQDVLAIGIRPWLLAGGTSGDGNRYAYPSTPEQGPPPLFQYWGFFCKEELDGGGWIPKECLLNDIGSSPGDGIIQEDELQEWLAVTNHPAAGGYAEDTPPDMDGDGKPVPGTGGDNNGDGIQNRTIDEVITRIVVTIRLEAPVFSLKVNWARTDTDGSGIIDNTEQPYYYKDVTLSQSLSPRNVRLRGTNTENMGL